MTTNFTPVANVSTLLPGLVLEVFDRDIESVSNSVPAKLSVVPVTAPSIDISDLVPVKLNEFVIATTTDYCRPVFDTAHDCARRAILEIGRANMLLGRVLAIKKPDRDLVCLDGGANLHIANSAKFCHDKVPSTMEVAGVLGSPTPCTSKGSLRLQPADDLPTVILTGAHVVEEFPYSFISESLLTAKGCTIIKKDDFAVVLDPAGQILFRACLRDGLFFVSGTLREEQRPSQFSVTEEKGVVQVARSYASRTTDDLLMQAHRKHSHMDMTRCAVAAGITLPAGYVLPICDCCVLGKSSHNMVTELVAN